MNRYSNQKYPTTPSTPAALLQVAQGTQDARSGLPLDVSRNSAYIDGYAIAASAIRVREHGERLSRLAAMFRGVSALAADALDEAVSEGLVR